MAVVVLGRTTNTRRTVAPRADLAAIGKANISASSAEDHLDSRGVCRLVSCERLVLVQGWLWVVANGVKGQLLSERGLKGGKENRVR